ncbi:MAG: phosphoribosyl-AMP cyclohydrolase [Nitrospinota bacterium]
MQEEESAFQLNFAKLGGLVTAIAQESMTKEILMVGFANLEALNRSIESGNATFFSRSKNRLWTKGESSGDYLRIVDILIDCDQDALIYLVQLIGVGACHTVDSLTGKRRRSCFYRKIDRSTGRLAPLYKKD